MAPTDGMYGEFRPTGNYLAAQLLPEPLISAINEHILPVRLGPGHDLILRVIESQERAPADVRTDHGAGIHIDEDSVQPVFELPHGMYTSTPLRSASALISESDWSTSTPSIT